MKKSILNKIENKKITTLDLYYFNYDAVISLINDITGEYISFENNNTSSVSYGLNLGFFSLSGKNGNSEKNKLTLLQVLKILLNREDILKHLNIKTGNLKINTKLLRHTVIEEKTNNKDIKKHYFLHDNVKQLEFLCKNDFYLCSLFPQYSNANIYNNLYKWENTGYEDYNLFIGNVIIVYYKKDKNILKFAGKGNDYSIKNECYTIEPLAIIKI